MIEEDPLFNVVIGVRFREGRVLHVTLAGTNVSAVEEFEAD